MNVKSLMVNALLLLTAPILEAKPLVIAVTDIAETFDPQENEISTNKIAKQVYESLVSFGPSGEPAPGLAKRWTINRKDQSITFYLDGSRTFSDGSVVESQLVRTSLIRSINKGSLLTTLVKDPESCRPKECASLVASGSAVTIKLQDDTYGLVLKIMAASITNIVKESGGALIGTGPFVVDTYSPKKVILKRRSNSKDFINEIHYLKLSLEDAKEKFMSGEIHELWSTVLPPEHAKQFQRIDFAFYGTYQIVFSTESGIFSHKDLRRAVSLAVDPKEIIKHLQREGIPASGYIPKGLLGHLGKSFTLDPKRASKLVEMALPLKKDRIAKLILHKSYQEKVAFTEYLVQAFAKIGLELKISFMEFKPALKAMKAQTHDMIFKADSVQYYDSSTIYVTLLKGNFSNITHYHNENLEKLVRASMATVDMAEKSTLLRSAEELVRNELPTLPLFYPARSSFYSKNLKTNFRSSDELFYWEFPYQNFSWR